MITAKQFDKAFAEVLAETENDKRNIVLDFLTGMQNFMDGNLDAEIDGATDGGLYLIELMNSHLDTVVYKRVISAMEKAHAVLMSLEA
ncbi:hypothetical protein [Paracoccus sp. SSK6]|uniref:hypothetical protein n=1 Tax=Paracoccus sp. SSK6 TaxID=3143131 RepID=UPI00321A1F49